MGVKTYLGFDYGTKKIGIAVGQSLTNTARDLDTVRNRVSDPDWDRISELVREWRPQALVVGVPLDGERRETTMSGSARAFGDALATRFQLPVHWVNEYLTSHAARDELRQSKKTRQDHSDQIAARLILETFLNAPR